MEILSIYIGAWIIPAVLVLGIGLPFFLMGLHDQLENAKFQEHRVKEDEKQELELNKERDRFDWITKIAGEECPEHFVYPFKNGKSIMVFKYDTNTSGMGYNIIDDYLPDSGKYRRCSVKGEYDYYGSVNMTKEQIDELYNKL